MAFAASCENPAKIDAKSDVHSNFDFGGVLDGFWEGLGRPKSSIFGFYFFEAKFEVSFGWAKMTPKSEK